MTIFSAEVNEIGENANEFLANDMLVLFGFDAPPELRPYCFIINQNKLSGSIEPKDKLIIDNVEYEIKVVGGYVNKNLRDLGHITINFSGKQDSSMAGTLYIEKKPVKDIHVGTKISINKN